MNHCWTRRCCHTRMGGGRNESDARDGENMYITSRLVLYDSVAIYSQRLSLGGVKDCRKCTKSGFHRSSAGTNATIHTHAS
jgi:hypothetical protein